MDNTSSLSRFFDSCISWVPIICLFDSFSNRR